MRPPKGSQQQLAALKGITAEIRRNVVDELDQRWCQAALNFLQRADEATEQGRSFDARNWVWAGGVATDKVFAIREIPTQIVANVHEHRVDLSGIIDKLSTATRTLSVHQRKGYAPIDASSSPSEVVKVITSGGTTSDKVRHGASS